MQKLQILFPQPVLAQLRELARTQDRAVSEIVRQAVESWLNKFSTGPTTKERAVPTFRGGKVLVAADKLRDTIYGEDE